MLINDTTRSARKICKAIKNNKYYDLDWYMIYTNDIDTTALVNDPEINFRGQISPLHYAALKGEFDIVEDLIRRGAKPEKELYHVEYGFFNKHSYSLTAFLYEFNKAQLVNLLNHFFDESNNYENIRNKITASANKSYNDLILGDINLLMKALNDDEKDLVQALIKAGANGNITNKESQDELFNAIKSENYKKARLLVNKAYKKKRNIIIYSAWIVFTGSFFYGISALSYVLSRVGDPQNLFAWGLSGMVCLYISIFAMIVLGGPIREDHACNRLEKIQQSKIGRPAPSAPHLDPSQPKKMNSTNSDRHRIPLVVDPEDKQEEKSIEQQVGPGN